MSLPILLLRSDVVETSDGYLVDADTLRRALAEPDARDTALRAKERLIAELVEARAVAVAQLADLKAEVADVRAALRVCSDTRDYAQEQLAARNNELTPYRLLLEEMRARFGAAVETPTDIANLIDSLARPPMGGETEAPAPEPPQPLGAGASPNAIDDVGVAS